MQEVPGTHTDVLRAMAERGASDLHITVGLPPMIRLHGLLEPLDGHPLSPEDTEHFVRAILSGERFRELTEVGETDLAVHSGEFRFRVNAYRQRGHYACALRLIQSVTMNLAQLGLPPVVSTLCQKTRGLILVTGPTGSGKSTTLAAMIDLINTQRNCHILTLEDPIEYLHTHKKAMVNQREMSFDSGSYAAALRAALREDPDIILVGEMRDLETISTALTAAETGHLVLSTLHTTGAAKTIDRIIDVFPPHQQQQVRVQLSMTLQAVVSQQLLPRADVPGRVLAVEVMLATAAIRNLIREGKTPQIMNAIATGARMGMVSMDQSLSELFKTRKISKEEAFAHALDSDQMVLLTGQRPANP